MQAGKKGVPKGMPLFFWMRNIERAKDERELAGYFRCITSF